MEIIEDFYVIKYMFKLGECSIFTWEDMQKLVVKLNVVTRSTLFIMWEVFYILPCSSSTLFSWSENDTLKSHIIVLLTIFPGIYWSFYFIKVVMVLIAI